MSSLFPQYIDEFTTKVNEAEGVTGDVVDASHVNDLQDSVVAIQESIGEHQPGQTIVQRLLSVENHAASMQQFRMPVLCFYSGTVKSINGSTTVAQAADIYKYFKHVILPSGKEATGEENTDLRNIIAANSSTNFYGTIDASLDTTEINLRLSWIKDSGLKGVYITNADLSSAGRTKQNTILNAVHAQDLVAVFGCTNPDSNMFEVNGTYPTAPALTHDDILVHLSFMSNGSTYADTTAANQKFLQYRSTYGTRIYALTTTSIATNPYLYAASVLYSYDGYYQQDSGFGSADNQILLYDIIPLLGGFYTSSPNVFQNGNVLSRGTEFGVITINIVTHEFSYDTVIPAYLLPESASDEVTQSDIEPFVIKAINATSDTTTINLNRITNYAETDADALRLKGAVVRLFTESDVSTVDIDPAAIKNKIAAALSSGDGAEVGLIKAVAAIIASVNANTLSANWIHAINSTAEYSVIQAAKIADLDASKITSGYISVNLIEPGSIIANHLDFTTKQGIDKWTLAYVLTPDRTQHYFPNKTDVQGKILSGLIEVSDTATLNLRNEILGATSGNVGAHVGLLTTMIVAKETALAFNLQVTCSGMFHVILNNTVISDLEDETGFDISNATQTDIVSIQLQPGVNTLQVLYEVLSGTPTIVFSPSISAKLADQPGRYATSGISRIDAYAFNTVTIDGAHVNVGTNVSISSENGITIIGGSGVQISSEGSLAIFEQSGEGYIERMTIGNLGGTDMGLLLKTTSDEVRLDADGLTSNSFRIGVDGISHLDNVYINKADVLGKVSVGNIEITKTLKNLLDADITSTEKTVEISPYINYHFKANYTSDATTGIKPSDYSYSIIHIKFLDASDNNITSTVRTGKIKSNAVYNTTAQCLEITYNDNNNLAFSFNNVNASKITLSINTYTSSDVEITNLEAYHSMLLPYITSDVYVPYSALASTAYIGSKNYVPDYTGWRITDAGDAELNNATIRGAIHSSVFVKEQIQATDGTLYIRPAAIIDEDITISITSKPVVAILNGEPGTILIDEHELVVDDMIWFTTTGTLPTGITASTTLTKVPYYIKEVISVDSFKISELPGGPAINISGTQSGTHTASWFGHQDIKLRKISQDAVSSFSVSDHLMAKISDMNGVLTVRMRITDITIDNTSTQYTITCSDISVSNMAVTTFTLGKGNVLLDLGQESSSGGIILSSDTSRNSGNVPVIDIYSNGPINNGEITTNLKVRLGNLDGIESELFGFPLGGFGLYAQNAFLTGTVALPNAGITDIGLSDSAVRLWAGASLAEVLDNPENAPFRVLQDGTLYATKGNFAGTFTVKDEDNITDLLTINTDGITMSGAKLQMDKITSDGTAPFLYISNPDPVYETLVLDSQADANTSRSTVFYIGHKTMSCTITIGTETTVTTSIPHGFYQYQSVAFHEINGSLPSGMYDDSVYYVHTILSDTEFILGESGSPLDTSGTAHNPYTLKYLPINIERNDNGEWVETSYRTSVMRVEYCNSFNVREAMPAGTYRFKYIPNDTQDRLITNQIHVTKEYDPFYETTLINSGRIEHRLANQLNTQVHPYIESTNDIYNARIRERLLYQNTKANTWIDLSGVYAQAISFISDSGWVDDYTGDFVFAALDPNDPMQYNLDMTVKIHGSLDVYKDLSVTNTIDTTNLTAFAITTSYITTYSALADIVRATTYIEAPTVYTNAIDTNSGSLAISGSTSVGGDISIDGNITIKDRVIMEYITPMINDTPVATLKITGI